MKYKLLKLHNLYYITTSNIFNITVSNSTLFLAVNSNMSGFTHLQQVRVLYKTILKLHRGLPQELQMIGDNYVRDEFKRHKKCNRSETDIFMYEWSEYAITLAKQLMVKNLTKGNESKFGKILSEDDMDKFRDDQVQQLYEMLKTTRGEASKEERNKT